jgi:putative membrane protein
MYGYHWGMGFGFFGLVIMILVIWLVVRTAMTSNFERYFNNRRSNSALDILNERYAKGEISKEEFEQKKRDIMS